LLSYAARVQSASLTGDRSRSAPARSVTWRLAPPDHAFCWREDVKIRYRDKEWELEGRRTVRQAIEEVGLSPQTLLAVRDGRVVADDVLLDEEDEVRLLPVISGG
jgi:sulfur carrier protein